MWRLAAVLALLLVVLAGCGGDGRRDAVEEYIERVNDAQSQLEASFTEAQKAIRAFASGATTRRTAERLRAASATMRESRASFVLIQPPPEARALHRDLLALLDLQARLSLEVSLAADYTRAVGDAIRPAQIAAATLGRELRSVETGDEQAVALSEYAGALGRALDRLDGLAPPPFLSPWHDDRRRRLSASRQGALTLAAGIRDRDSVAVERALEAFTTAAPEDALVEAQTAAVKAFNRLLDEQERLVDRLAREHSSLIEKFSS
jgi:hypothetical protein